MKDEFDKLVMNKRDTKFFKMGEQRATQRIVGIIRSQMIDKMHDCKWRKLVFDATVYEDLLKEIESKKC